MKSGILGSICAAMLLHIPLTAVAELPEAALAPVTVVVTGDGTVVSDPPGIECPDTCTASFPRGSTVSLTAAPDPNGTFMTYTGDCTGTETSCAVLVAESKTVNAFFDILATGARLPETGVRLCWPYNSSDDPGPIPCEGTGQDGEIRAGAAPSFTDNGDGTLTDNNTLLMWEKKDASGGVHDRYNAYYAEEPFAFVNTLNTTCNGEGVTICTADNQCGAGEVCGFAGYQDWRLPNVKEFMTIMVFNYPGFYPPGQQSPWRPPTFPEFYSPCFEGCTVTECSCSIGFTKDPIGPHRYVTNTTTDKAHGWHIEFGSNTAKGSIFIQPTQGRVRAVRGGL